MIPDHQASNPNFNPRPSLGYALSVASALCTAGYFTLARYVLQWGDPIFLGGMAILIAGGLLSIWVFFHDGLFWVKKITPRGWLFTALFTFFSTFAFGAFIIGISMLNASSASFLSRISTVVILILGIGFLKERFNFFESVAGLVVIVGVFIVKGCIVLEVSAGFWWIMVSSITFGVVEIIAKIAVRYILPYHLNTIRNFTMGVILFSWAAVHGNVQWNYGMLWLGVLGMGIIGPLAARTIYLYALRNLEVSKTTLVNQIQPVFVVLLAMMFLGEKPCWQELAGGALIITGCVGIVFFRPEIINRLRNRKPRAVEVELDRN